MDANDRLRKRTEKYKKAAKVTNYNISNALGINLSTLPRFLNFKRKAGERDKVMSHDSMVKLDNYLELKGY
jgi:hypothetical protein